MSKKRISVIGLGYIGLPTATVLASRQIQVIGVDVNEKAVDTINQGRIHIVEPDLDMLVHAAVSQGFLKATTTPEPADAFLIAVPTPFKEGKKPDLSYIEAAAKSIAPVLKKGDLVILESTSPVGATEQLARWLADVRQDLTFPQDVGEHSDIRVAHCPERVLPGHVLRELVENDRIVGGMTHRCSEAARELYETFVRGDCIVTDVRTAELCKLTENSFRDVNIAFANELSVISDRLKINVWELIRLANRHPRVNILQPGPGVGGHCIAVDPWFIVDSVPADANLIRTAREVNDRKPKHVLAKLTASANRFKEPVIAMFGLSFKANIDDLRESPALDIVQEAVEQKMGKILVVEPNISKLPTSLSGKTELVTADVALESADIIVLLVDHKQFLTVDLDRLQERVVIDTRGIWSKPRGNRAIGRA
ncbi:UDP-N-acetyl-D-mannosamine dehydrogenase [Cupriavidus lacunae]|uniref:NDP-N-acetyl-D-galactosaminuronic acid dehydrogenase n=1 Tax=Cupriavidus lacunae TaxID=2666307 RepID=A0A370NY10_9BURK|nr:UDP-N-acetyl-D-mannosamine dehydrogenase [Cupriavidus lacunae]RDK10480.1 UDP-N-acetyl-D-mannosamine dehydrogenase [Cupriavidus lacunae]